MNISKLSPSQIKKLNDARVSLLQSQASLMEQLAHCSSMGWPTDELKGLLEKGENALAETNFYKS